MAYDESKDKCIVAIPNVEINEKTSLEIGVYQYDGGPKKIRMKKVTKGKGDRSYNETIAKLTLVEFETLVAAAPELIGKLK